MADGSFKLGAQLIGHEQDVRAVCAGHDGSIITGSRDRTVIVWKRNEGTSSYSAALTLRGHTHYVTSVAFIQASPDFPEGCIASGSWDRSVIIWNAQTGAAIRQLVGHEKEVSSLSITPDGNVISGSWDFTARVWNARGEAQHILKGHEKAVWTVLAVENGDVLTGSADTKIRLWRGSQCTKVFAGHGDAVRCIALVPGLGFVSASNDTTLRLWAMGGDCLQIMSGHSEFIYSVCVLPDGRFASGAEDRTVQIWKDFNSAQTLLHTSTVWSVAALPNGDVASACSDGVARVFTTSAEREAEPGVQESYNASVEASLHSGATRQSDMDLSKLPGIDQLNVAGKKDGEMKVFRNGQRAEAYSWSKHSNNWVLIGTVVDGPGGPKEQIGGEFYDHVFDVDAGDGIMRKLGYNNGTNEYDAAQKFITRNELNQEALEEIADFIRKNTRGFTLGATAAPAGAGLSDPFTGAYRYIPPPPTGSSQQPAYNTALADPFTGAHRYIPGSGGSESRGPATPAYKYIPVGSPQLFTAAKLDAVLAKAEEFNKSGIEGELSGAQMATLRRVVGVLKDTGKYHVSSVSADELDVLHAMLAWPQEKRFPALDLLRLAVLHPAVSRIYIAQATGGSNIIQSVVEANLQTGVSSPCRTMALRFVANCFKNREMRAPVVIPAAGSVLDRASGSATSETANERVALAFVLVNYATAADQLAEGDVAKLVQISSTMVGREDNEDAAFSAVTALGTAFIRHLAPAARAAGDANTREALAIAASQQAFGAKVGDAVVEVLQHLNTFSS